MENALETLIGDAQNVTPPEESPGPKPEVLSKHSYEANNYLSFPKEIDSANHCRTASKIHLPGSISNPSVNRDPVNNGKQSSFRTPISENYWSPTLRAGELEI